jgi:hypothetical protein
MHPLPLLLLLATAAQAQPALPQPATTTPPADQSPPKPALPQTPAPPPPSWQPGHTATLQVLDKLDTQSATLTIPVGGTQSFRTLSITVRACYTRPPDQPQDATALLVIADPATPAPLFTGWMLAAEPADSMLQHPVYDVRVLTCS